MDWFNQLGNYAQLFPDTPALAFDFATHGPPADFFGYGLVAALQGSQTPLDAYPVQASPFEGA